MSWDYELIHEILERSGKREAVPPILEGTVVSTAPLTLSFWGGEVMAPPLPLESVVGAQGVYRDKNNGHLYLEQWRKGDRAVCCLMGQTAVILGRLGSTSWAIPTR